MGQLSQVGQRSLMQDRRVSRETEQSHVGQICLMWDRAVLYKRHSSLIYDRAVSYRTEKPLQESFEFDIEMYTSFKDILKLLKVQNYFRTFMSFKDNIKKTF